MPIDTVSAPDDGASSSSSAAGGHPPSTSAADVFGQIQPGVSPASAEVVSDDEAFEKVDPSDDGLLAHLDGVFGPSLAAARVGASVIEKPKPTAAERQLAAKARFLAMSQLGPTSSASRHPHDRTCWEKRATLVHRAPRPVSATGQRIPRRGLGPRLFVGFDCEWVFTRKGQNRIISVQFYVYGPTGKTYFKLFDLATGHVRSLRLRLGDALDVVLDEAETHGVFADWPHEVVLAGFFTRADITVFSDFKEFRHQLDAINGTFASVAEPIKLELPMDEARVERLKSRHRYVVGNGYDPRELKVRLIDVSRLGPPGASLDQIGSWLKAPKVELPAGYEKSDMLRFLRERPEEFAEYARQDARLPVLFAMWVLWFSDRHLGIKGLSSTVSGLAVRLCELCMRRDGVHPDVALNFETVKRYAWDSVNGRPVTRVRREANEIRQWFETMIAATYRGGRNETYMFGPTSRSMFYDADLSGAYVGGLADFMTVDYAAIRISRDAEDFKGHVAGFAKVRFAFPADTRFPCLPVDVGDRGLWFTLSGVSNCTAPEIELALAMGADIEIEIGVILPWKDRDQVFAESAQLIARWQAKQAKKPAKIPLLEKIDEDTLIAPTEMKFPPDERGDIGYRPMESFAIYVRHVRQQYVRKTLPFEFVKLVGNGLYGKTGQGLKGKRSFGPKEMAMKTIGPSRVTEAAVASMVCGLVRAVVGEILSKLPPDAVAVSVTTDGMLVDVPIEKIDLSGPICRRFQALVDRVAPGTSMLELKHGGFQVMVPRTRGVFTVEAAPGFKTMTAKAGHKVVLEGDAENRKKLLSDEGSSEWMIRLMLGRYPGQVLPRESFFSLRDQLVNDWDIQKESKEIKVSLEYDFKRKPINPRMVRLAPPYDVEHITFDTVPWPTAEEGELVCTIFYQWRQKNVLKNLEDWKSWEAFRIHHMGNRRRKRALADAFDQAFMAMMGLPVSGSRPTGAGRGVTRGAGGVVYVRGGDYVRVVVRTFLTAFVQKAWGLHNADMSRADLVAWLTESGYPVKAHDIKNAGRSLLNEHVVAPTPEVMAFLDVVKARFPDLEVERFVAVD